MILQKVISGGQTGADQAGILAAAEWGEPNGAYIITGGWMPKGWRTENGSEPQWREYGLQEHPLPTFPPRTRKNVEESDGTLRMAYDFGSAGERLTRKLCIELGKPFFDIVIREDIKPDPRETAEWINSMHIRTLNVAGNRESTYPGIGRRAKLYLLDVFYWLEQIS